MRTRFTSILTLSLLITLNGTIQTPSSAQIRKSTPGRDVPRTVESKSVKLETSGGAKPENKATRKTKGRQPLTITASSAQATELAVGDLNATDTGTPDEPATQVKVKEGVLAPKTAQNYDVGIIAGAYGCPLNSESIIVYLDNEDDRNANSSSGWIGAIKQNRNTTFKFCRVNGQLFPQMPNVPYAVLQLGTCPQNAVSIMRTFNDEDDWNEDTHSTSAGGSINPNLQYAPSFTTLKFCMFLPYTPTFTATPNFPDLGVEYGVLAPGNLPVNYGAGTLHTDDEDRNNENGFDYNYHINYGLASQIISGSYNTDINIVKVRPSPPIPNLHSMSLNMYSVKGSQNGSEPTLTVYLDGPAPPNGINVYLSTSNDNLAWLLNKTAINIPAGQTSGAISWFLGTKNVIVTRTVDIIATVNGVAGHITLTLTP
jgi:hypothetical protein